MLQLNRIKKANRLLQEVYEEVLNGYIDNDIIQEAVNTQVTVNRLVFELNECRGGQE